MFFPIRPAGHAAALFVSILVVCCGCSEDEDDLVLDSNLTRNSAAFEISGPPYTDTGFGFVGTPLPDASIVVHFVDMDESDPQTGAYEVRAQDQGLSNLNGAWSCTVRYTASGVRAADYAYIWVNHARYAGVYEQHRLTDDGHITARIGLGR